MSYLTVVNMWKGRRGGRLSFCFILAVTVLPGVNTLGQQSAAPAAEPGIQDNSFLVEEAYNQNFGVVQHISSFTRLWNSKDWNYSFTQEWPVPGDERHQLSYTLVALHSGGLPGSGVGIGDVLLNYRYQLVGSGDTRIALSPRLSLILPAGDSTQGRGAGSSGVQTSLPLSVVLNKKLVSHWNLGATYFPHAQDVSGDQASSADYNLGQSFIWLAHARFNVMLETVFARSQEVVGSHRTEWTNSLFSAPGSAGLTTSKMGCRSYPGRESLLGWGRARAKKAFCFI